MGCREAMVVVVVVVVVVKGRIVVLLSQVGCGLDGGGGWRWRSCVVVEGRRKGVDRRERGLSRRRCGSTRLTGHSKKLVTVQVMMYSVQ